MKNCVVIDANRLIDNSTAMAGGKMIYWEQVLDMNITSSFGQNLNGLCLRRNMRKS